MLQLLIASVNVFTKVGVSDLKASIHATKLVQFQYNVVDMRNKILMDFEIINERWGFRDDTILNLYNFVLSDKNDIYNCFIEQSKDDWEVGAEKTHYDLDGQSVTKYNNMVKKGFWEQTAPIDATILSLTTHITNLEKKISEGASGRNSIRRLVMPLLQRIFTQVITLVWRIGASNSTAR